MPDESGCDTEYPVSEAYPINNSEITNMVIICFNLVFIT